ncbi:unnamed protein product [Rotaria magnacalcarata]|uniref:Uncharacterized protein n=3 Tax=Rotaria magnacalcarata TaxID=392030 RepID=A0A814NTM2_9BILA|nr:unnamed protein product [Rotaria magnacalcarata]
MQNQLPLFVLPSPQRENIQQRLLLFLNPTPPPIVQESIVISSSEKTESGWSSPPRTIITDYPSADQLSLRSSSPPLATTTTNYNGLINQNTTIEADTKPIRSLATNNMLQFAEQFQDELDQLRNTYKLKFAKDRTYIEQEINLLIDEERKTLDTLNRYLSDHRRNIEKRNHNKRKYNTSSSPH